MYKLNLETLVFTFEVRCEKEMQHLQSMGKKERELKDV